MKTKPSLWLLVGLCLALMVSMSAGPTEAAKNNRCEGTKKQRKQKMELRSLTDAQLAGLVEDYKKTVAAERERMGERVLRRLEREYQAHRTSGAPFVYDVLVISGGGAKGAFGAGFLEGWAAITSGPTARPEFDAVTGVSTGSLIAPFAFVGTQEDYVEVSEFYANPEANWVKERGKFSFLPHHVSMFNDCHLQETVRKALDEVLVGAVAQGAAEDRLLLIGATNLDAGRGRAFDLSEEAQAAPESGPFDRINSILLASSAIPAVFPPVEIDGMYYGDGGATSNLFLLTFSATDGPLAQFVARHPEAPKPKFRIWIVVNELLVPEPAVTQPRWISVSGRALDTLTSTTERFALKLIKDIVDDFRIERGVDAEFRMVAIPANAPKPKTNQMFDKDYMIQLEELGRNMGADPSSWRTELPFGYSFGQD
jgi:predicted acylesterase/phospholipase RssA